jgi:beta-lactamase regulating signal transducer with metallopeptidase domain
MTTEATMIFFNLLANATMSLVVGLMIVGACLWFFRIETGRWKVFFLSLPFLKIVYDLVRGLPADSILIAGIDPFTLPPKSQYFMLGAGFSTWGPILNAVFGVKDQAGTEYAASVGDYLAIWLNREFGPGIPLAIVSTVFGVALALLAMRIVHALRFEKRRREDRANAYLLRTIPGRFRDVDVYVSDAFSGTPFTGGLLKPYICVPADSFESLSTEELESVLAHELGHVRQFDLAITVAVQLLGDLFWFVPGYRWLSRKIDRMREVVADQWAIANGAHPAQLASALIKLKEIPETPERFVLYSAFFREKSLLKERVDRLIGRKTERPARFGWNKRAVRVVAGFWIFMAVMIATFGGNHATARIANPEWFDYLMRSLGLP